MQRALDLDPRCVNALVGLALVELNGKEKVSSSELGFKVKLRLGWV